MNRITIWGNLGADVEVKEYTPKNGQPKPVKGKAAKPVTKRLATFRIASSEGEGEQRTTTWFNGVAFGKVVDQVAAFGKGDFVKVTGTVVEERWEDSDGNKRTSYKVRAFAVEPGAKNGEPESDEDDGENMPF